MESVQPGREEIGFIGLGHMGGHFARRLLAAGWRLRVHDLRPEAVSDLVELGAEPAGSVAGAVGEVVLLSLRSSDILVEVAEREVLPALRPGAVVVDLGTTRVTETRLLAELAAERQAWWVDAPVSGDPRQPVFIFAGGAPEAFARVRPLLAVLARPDKLTHAGPPGSGQVLKGVNQLAMGLVAAAWLETVSFAERQGLDPRLVAAAVGDEGGWRGELAKVCAQVAAGHAEGNDLKLAELPYFLDAGLPLPLTEALHRFCEPGPHDWRDNMGREFASFWWMLHRDPAGDDGSSG